MTTITEVASKEMTTIREVASKEMIIREVAKYVGVSISICYKVPVFWAGHQKSNDLQWICNNEELRQC